MYTESGIAHVGSSALGVTLNPRVDPLAMYTESGIAHVGSSALEALRALLRGLGLRHTA